MDIKYKTISWIDYNNLIFTDKVNTANEKCICMLVNNLVCMAEPNESRAWNVNIQAINKGSSVKSALLFCVLLATEHNINYIHITKKWRFFENIFNEYIVETTSDGVVYELCKQSLDLLLLTIEGEHIE